MIPDVPRDKIGSRSTHLLSVRHKKLIFSFNNLLSFGRYFHLTKIDYTGSDDCGVADEPNEDGVTATDAIYQAGKCVPNPKNLNADEYNFLSVYGTQ